MARLFGTDGVRGLANVDLTAELALDLSVAAAHVLGEAGAFGSDRPTAVVGRDTRASGEFLEAAVVAGLASAGLDVLRVGILPTPAVAYLTGRLDAELGVMLSASHNPMPDNGIKFFTKGGHKLEDALEDAIESRMREPWKRPTGADVGRIRKHPQGLDAYVEHVASTVPHRLDGLKVVVDCAHGAAYRAAPEVLRHLGADVVAVCAEPDGLNINDGCGSTHIESLAAAVVEHGADVGIAHDGDADRCLAVDAAGKVVDGDQILAILALAMHEEGTLRHQTVVATVMSNEGLRLAMREAGITVVDTAVGDRYVLEAMREGGYGLGGEQSGHLILLDHVTTGDGVLTAAHLLARVAHTGRPLAELAGVMQRLPQVLVNVSGVDKARVATDHGVRDAVTRAEAELGETGRVLLRPSGTEPVVRVMVEAATLDQADAVAGRLAAAVESTLAL
ncbi:phosphoglucosamine mutase [Phytoactinopolyspora halotolerans]|uniref:Phosphoglucosamine mutase n=1 Tax=Phytoactinopolyspora halotolerans TaxID=1981512 RepID=A0A6L9S4U6_9ACTN|nr:phosphoglucosamine mutase [Phytoactinopolyspora halotolerans]NEE00166.1 phosphoglucosamine mutase [Phytoactinopolyspora halotolerans]